MTIIQLGSLDLRNFSFLTDQINLAEGKNSVLRGSQTVSIGLLHYMCFENMVKENFA